MPMLGVPLSTYEEPLHRIPKGITPVKTIDRFYERFQVYEEEFGWLKSQYDTSDPAKFCHALPREFYRSCTFEELAKIWGSHFIQLIHEVDEMFNEDPKYYIIKKICNSMWRWGSGTSWKEWNFVVDAYNGIRNFSFGLPDFEVTLDYTTSYNEYGYAAHDRTTYLDGIFGFLVHYRGQHVMTIGFSIAQGGKLLLSQVQLKKAKGNRFLFKLPTDRMSYVVGLMKKYFPSFRHYLVDGKSLVTKYLADFRGSLKDVRNSRSAMADKEFAEKQIRYFEEHIALLLGDAGERIRKTYRLRRCDYRISTHRPVAMNKLLFRRIVRAKPLRKKRLFLYPKQVDLVY